jgi:hypothetical protein
MGDVEEAQRKEFEELPINNKVLLLSKMEFFNQPQHL